MNVTAFYHGCEWEHKSGNSSKINLKNVSLEEDVIAFKLPTRKRVLHFALHGNMLWHLLDVLSYCYGGLELFSWDPRYVEIKLISRIDASISSNCGDSCWDVWTTGWDCKLPNINLNVKKCALLRWDCGDGRAIPRGARGQWRASGEWVAASLNPYSHHMPITIFFPST